MNDKEKIKKICKQFLYEKYSNIDLNSLAVYTIEFLHKNEIFLNFENVAVSLFLMFPKKFCMVGFQEYPDTNRINRTVNLQLRPKYQNLAYGDPKKGYSLTEKGKAVADQVRDILSSSEDGVRLKKSKIEDTSSQRTTSPETFVRERILSNDMFKKYDKNKDADIEKVELYEFLHASPYTSKDVLRTNFNSLKNVTKKSDIKEAKEFLVWLEKKLLKTIHGDKK